KRVTSAPPFHNAGVDFAGPFLIKSNASKKYKLIQCYLCVYVCMCTKAVHLELVSSLCTEAFLASFKRFISRRGRPQKMFSDNGTNFTRAASHLRQLYKFFKQANIQT